MRFAGPPPGGDQFDFVQTFDPRIIGAVGALSASVANLSLVRVAKPTLISTLKIYVGTGGSNNVDVGIYQLIGANYTLMSSSGSIAVGASTSVQTLTLAAPVTLLPGVDYWFALACDSATPTFYRTSGTAAVIALGSQAIGKATTFPLATFTSPGAVTANLWLFGS